MPLSDLRGLPCAVIHASLSKLPEQHEDGMSSTIDPNHWFERIVYALVMREDSPAEVVAMGQDAAVLRFPPTGSRVLLMRYLPERDQDMATHLRDGITQLAHAPLEVALIGGPPEAQKFLEKSKPRFTRKPLSLYHLRDDGTLWQSGARRKQATPLAAELVPPQGAWPPPEDDRARFAAKIEQQLAATGREQEEMSSFSAAMQKRRPLATWALAATIAVVFALQMLWGATEGGPTLVRMGALVPGLIRDGEWWRLVSCTFLHGGYLHLALNMLVLVMLGNVLERILGTSRFLVLYGASALAGSLASFLAGDERISVGASGALWGLLVADAVLAFRPRGLLPAAMIAQAKRAAMTNLVFNLANSFRPQVDMAAHFGGGAVGLLLLGAGALTVGLRPLVIAGPPSEDGAGPATAEARPGLARALTAGAILVVIALAAGLGLGLARGRAWAIGEEAPEMARREVPALGMTALLPAELAAGNATPIQPPGQATGAEAATATFGDFLADPVIIELMRIPMAPPLPAEQIEGEMAGLVAALAEPPEDGNVQTAPERLQAQGQPAVRAAYTLKNGVILERAVALAPDHLVRVDVAIWPEYRAAYDGLATRILESLQPLAAP
jgi:rhomboid protease GluP